jgi:anaerobic dimethyl sulfoxide reductase subunit B (iron-sulfur subunit)
MSTEYNFSFDNEKCIQCFGCEVACRTWRGIELGVKWRSVKNIWIGKYPDVTSTSLSAACMHCADPVCVSVCPENAIKKRAKDGIVVVDRGKCVGCGTCLEECNFSAPQIGADGKMQKCDLCVHEIDHDKEFPPCVETCPTQALQLVKSYSKDKKREEKKIAKLMAM